MEGRREKMKRGERQETWERVKLAMHEKGTERGIERSRELQNERDRERKREREEGMTKRLTA